MFKDSLRSIRRRKNTATARFVLKLGPLAAEFFMLWEMLEGVQVGGIIKIPEHKEKDWKELLQVAINAICNNTDDIVVFLWDELPYMLQKINEYEVARGSVESSSLQIMDTLRALRKEQKGLRMVFTGSIGLHHVLKTLTNETYASESVNDMDKIALLPLSKESAQEMVKFHLNKECPSHHTGSEILIKSIAQQCDGIPFYIEKSEHLMPDSV